MARSEEKSRATHGGARAGAGRKPKNQDESLSIQKILDIIKTCSSTNVKALKYGPLEVEFHEKPTYDSAQSASEQEDKEETRLTQLMIDDPSGFEQEVMDSQRWSE